MKYICKVIILGSLLIAPLVNANSQVIQDVCNTCFTNSQYEQRVIALIKSHSIQAIPANFYIYNYEHNVIKKYSGSSELLDEGGIMSLSIAEREYYVTPLALSSIESTKFSAAVYGYHAIKSNLQDTVIPSNIVDSAYSLVGVSYKENDLADYYNENRTFTDKMSEFLAAAASVTGTLPNVKIDVEVTLSDHSTALLRLEGIDKDGTIRLKFMEGRDSDNNTISTNATHYTKGSYRFTQQGDDGIARMLDAARRLGVPISYGEGLGYTGGDKLLSCSEIGGETICTITRDPL